MRIGPTKLLHGLLYSAPVILLTLAACGGGGDAPPAAASAPASAYTVGGAVSGVDSAGLVLRLNGGGDLTVASGVPSYVFGTSVTSGTSYKVTILTHPSAPARVCTLASAASGVMPAGHVTNADVTCLPAFTIGGFINGAASAVSGVGPILQNNGGDNLFIPSLPASGAAVAFTFSIPVASGVTYAVTQLSRAKSPSQDCSDITPESGVASASSISAVTITCVLAPITPKSAYVTNSASDTVSAYTIDSVSGILADETAVAAGDKPNSIAVDPTGRFAYVVNFNDKTITAYSVGAASGVLTPMDADGVAGTPTIATGEGPFAIAVHPSGKFAYVVNFTDNTRGNSVSAYSIDAASGALSAMDADGATADYQASIATGVSPNAIAIDPTGQFAYVANNVSNTVSAYTIDETTGALTEMADSPFDAGTEPTSIAIDPTGQVAVVTDSTSGDVMSYTISASGVLGSGIPVAISGVSAAPRSVAIDPDTGVYVYVASAGVDNVTAFSLDPSTGILTFVDDYAASGVPVSVTVDPSGVYVYVARRAANTVSTYEIIGGGALSAVGETSTGGSPTSVTTTQ